MKFQSRWEQEEESKAALLSRIQRLTKLFLVSTKSSPSSRLFHRSNIRRGHSFGEEELAYLLHRKQDLILDEDNAELYVSIDGNVENNNDALKEEKKAKKPGLLNWLKPRVSLLCNSCSQYVCLNPKARDTVYFNISRTICKLGYGTTPPTNTCYNKRVFTE
ncbi:kinesin-like protein KIN-7K, chloroplastic isoform X2 [Tanacetum coccineum]